MTEKISLRIDPDALTIGDLEDFEDGVGQPLHEALKPVPVRDAEGNLVLGEPDAKGKRRPETEVKVSAKALKYLIWIVKRADSPGFSLEDARSVKVGSLEIAGDGEDEGNDDGQTAPDA